MSDDLPASASDHPLADRGCKGHRAVPRMHKRPGRRTEADERLHQAECFKRRCVREEVVHAGPLDPGGRSDSIPASRESLMRSITEAPINTMLTMNRDHVAAIP